jgi:hypothetical protein
MSRPYRKILTRYVRFRNPFARLFGYDLEEFQDTQTEQLLTSNGAFLFGSVGQPIYQSTP